MVCYAVQDNLLQSAEGNSGSRPYCVATSAGSFIGACNMKTKQCNTCGIVQPETNFYAPPPDRKPGARCRKCANAARDLRRKANLKADLAKTLANNAVRDGILVNPGQCASCGEVRSLQKHHENYSKPYEVTWLCPKCHGQLHSAKRRRERELVS